MNLSERRNFPDAMKPVMLSLLLSHSRQDDQHDGHGNRSSNPRRDLRERHELHPVGRRQDGDVSGASLSAMTGIHDRYIDRIHVQEACDYESCAHQ